jgi:hypothetical protein
MGDWRGSGNEVGGLSLLDYGGARVLNGALKIVPCF